MSYVSLLKTIPDFLSQPAGIAVLASVGIHGVIALMLPLMPVETKKTKEVKTPKPVGVVELNQAERQRIPQTSSRKLTPNLQPNLQSQVILPEFATKATPLPTLAPPPLATPSISSTQVMPPLPISDSELGISSLPKTRRNRTKNDNYFRVTPENRFEGGKSFIANKSSFEFKDPANNSNPNPNQISQPKVETKAKIGNNTQRNTQANNSQTNSNKLPNLEAGSLPSGLPGKAVPFSVSGTSVSGLPLGNQVLNNSSGSLQVTNSTINTGQNQRLVTGATNSSQVNDKFVVGTNAVQIPQNKVKSPSAKKVITEPELIARVKQNTPNIEIQSVLLQPTIALPPGENATNVKGGLVLDGEGRVDLFELLDKSVSSNLKVVVRDYFKNYFQKNPLKATGKPKYFSFNVVFEPGNARVSSSDSQSLRKRLRAIKESRGSQSNPSPSSAVPGSKVTNEKSSSSVPLNIQSVIRTDRSSNIFPSNQRSQPAILSQRLRSIAVSRKDGAVDSNQISSSKRKDQKNLIRRLREVREQRKIKTSDFQ